MAWELEDPPAFAGSARVRASGPAAWLFARIFGGLDDPAGALRRARAQLFLWMPVALACGIGAYFAQADEPGLPVYAVIGLLVLVGAPIALRGADVLRFPAALIALAALGFVLAGARAHSVAAPVLAHRYYGPVEGRVIGIDRSSADYPRITLDQVRLDGTTPPARLRIALHDALPDALPPPGTRVMTSAHLMPPPPQTAPGAYDFRRAAWFDRLGAIGYTSVPVLRAAAPDPSDWALAAHRARHALSAAIRARVPGQAGAMAAAFLTGDRSGLTEATREAMRRSNLAHLIAISGLHMGLLAGFVFGFVRYGLAFVGRPALVWPIKKIAAVVALLVATGYLWLSGAAVSTQRAWIMVAVMLLAVLLDRRALSLRSVALAATLLLLWHPEALTAPGFQMSFAATTALIVALGPFARLQRRLPGPLRPAVMLLATSVVAGAATAPIVAAEFHRLSEYGVLANLLAVPAMGLVVMPAGVIAALLAPVGLAQFPLWIMGLGTGWILRVAEQVAALDGGVVAVVQPAAAVLPLLALGGLLVVLARGVARSAGGVIVAVAALMWWQAPAYRPAVLIAPEGELVGLMTPEGRVLSKAAASFVGGRWLEADGDPASPRKAANRAAFSGPSAARVARLGARSVVHLTGKSAMGRLAELCHDDALVVIAAWVRDPPTGCEIWDKTRLAQTGAVALDAQGRVAARASRGHRLWTP